MSTYDERWVQAHKIAQWRGDLAYKQGRGKEEMAMLYHNAYTREMAAFDALEALRKNAPNQAAVDEMAAALLRDAPLTVGVTVSREHPMTQEEMNAAVRASAESAKRQKDSMLKAAPAPEMPHHCPECDGQISHGHFCPKCDYQLEA